MVLPKGPFWEHVEETDESWLCTFCRHPFSKLTRITRFKLHWSGVPGCGTTICDEVPEHVREAAFAAVDGPPEKKLKTTATSSNDGAHNTISTSLLEQNSQVGNVVTDVEMGPELCFSSPREQEFMQTNMESFQLDRVSSFPRDLIPGEQVEQECERNTQDNLPLPVEDYRIEGKITVWNQLVVRGGSPERLTVNEDEPRGDSSQPGGLQCPGLQRNYDQQCSSSVNNDVNNDLCPSKKKHKATAGSSNNEVTNAISASAQEQNNKVMAQQGEALSDQDFEEWIASIPVEEHKLRHSSPEELLPNEFQTAPRTERAHQDCEGRTSDISSLFMEDNVVCNSIENTTTATGLMQHSERGSSHERLSINQVETHGDSTHPTDLPCLDLGIHYDHLCPSSLNNDVIMNDVKNMIRESGQLVVRGSSHEGPLVNCDEPQGDSSQPTDQPFHNLGRYHDQLCTPLVNMVGDPGQTGAGASSTGGLTCNTYAIKGDAAPPTKLVGQAFKDHEKTFLSWLMREEVSTIGISMGWAGWVRRHW
ncbi:hypothetical protein BDE02_18G126500 [Populus trichocarpa]|nr:hypothetical protein BDE02_18G126500 [Populus trichocarpa]